MVLKNVFAAVLCTALSAWGSLAFAEPYQAGEFLSLDLARAVLSPKPLGPAAEFAPFPVEASEPALTEHVTHPSIRAAHLRSDKRPGVTPTRLARRHGNPLDAEAQDTRIQVWPCRSGAICGWKR